MSIEVNRRTVLAGVAASAAAAVFPPRVAAATYYPSEQHRRVLDLAKDLVERHRPALWRTDMVGIADFAMPSSLPRFHFANLEKGEVRSFLVAHGRGSDPEHDGFLKNFSNEVGSLATSRGAYVTYEWYKGKYGTSIRLGGLSPENTNVLDRAIVLHPAWYANPEMLDKWGKLGRSDGCFAMGEGDFNEALWHLSGGRLIYADRLGLG
ncbi:murein L,D-transpeptidase catalytic domain-containing protein [Novosphingobium sp. MMS21-SN21R]|uniref:murein L,D-transpeptidase catalytic domain-containing protein n=1 Tax=Novosphingobium sp. MMS21-SN21R TaxID=2969298 RepID=UPI002886CC3B|nr:murein L,D-transpeptidase catalytic domain family protein [Novosphingobium sp. MMS21-SN21R]MDT0506707.1 murein L,D-transpeptidase catalytic domain family protein [Novosphingobium sp. MMS21-SN21R]